MQRSRLHRHFVLLVAGILALVAVPSTAEESVPARERRDDTLVVAVR